METPKWYQGRRQKKLVKAVRLTALDNIPGVNICPKKSETVYPGIRGIFKSSVLVVVNQKIFKTVCVCVARNKSDIKQQDAL